MLYMIIAEKVEFTAIQMGNSVPQETYNEIVVCDNIDTANRQFDIAKAASNLVTLSIYESEFVDGVLRPVTLRRKLSYPVE